MFILKFVWRAGVMQKQLKCKRKRTPEHRKTCGAEGPKKRRKGEIHKHQKETWNLTKLFESIEHKVHPIWRQSSKLVDHPLYNRHTSNCEVMMVGLLPSLITLCMISFSTLSSWKSWQQKQNTRLLRTISIPRAHSGSFKLRYRPGGG